MRGGSLLAVCALMWVPAAVMAEEPNEPGAWLIEVSHAQRSTNYQGILLHRSGESIDSFRVIHRHKNGEARERLQTLTGDPRDVVRRGDKVICLVPPGNRLPESAMHGLPQSMIPKLDKEQLQRINQSYVLAPLGESRIAGRRCQGVSITPRDPLRYGYEVWADKETKVPLKVLLKDSDGTPIEQIMFTEVRFPEMIPDDVFDITPQLDQGYASMAQERIESPLDVALAGRPTVKPDVQMGLVSIPEGFEVVMFTQRELPNGTGTLRHWIISDGLTSVSIFGRQSIGERPASMPQSSHALGAMHAYRQIVGKVEITVVGEVPSQTVRVIAEGTSQRMGSGAAASAPTSASP